MTWTLLPLCLGDGIAVLVNFLSAVLRPALWLVFYNKRPWIKLLQITSATPAPLRCDGTLAHKTNFFLQNSCSRVCRMRHTGNNKTYPNGICCVLVPSLWKGYSGAQNSCTSSSACWCEPYHRCKCYGNVAKLPIKNFVPPVITGLKMHFRQHRISPHW